MVPPSIAASSRPSGFKSAANLQQGARQIVDEMQRKSRDDQVERLVGERQRLLVRLHARAPALRQQAARSLHVDDHLDAGQAAQAPAEQAVMRPEIERDREDALDRRQALHQVVGDAGQQEIVICGPIRRAVAPRDEQAPVEDVVIGGHRRKLVRRLAVFNLRCHPGISRQAKYPGPRTTGHTRITALGPALGLTFDESRDDNLALIRMPRYHPACRRGRAMAASGDIHRAGKSSRRGRGPPCAAP